MGEWESIAFVLLDRPGFYLYNGAHRTHSVSLLLQEPGSACHGVSRALTLVSKRFGFQSQIRDGLPGLCSVGGNALLRAPWEVFCHRTESSARCWLPLSSPGMGGSEESDFLLYQVTCAITHNILV